MLRVSLGWAAGVLGLCLAACGNGGGGGGTPDSGGQDPEFTVQLVTPSLPIRVSTTLDLRWMTSLPPDRIDLLIDGQVTTSRTSTTAKIFTAQLPEGDHDLEIRASQGARHATTGIIPFIVDHTPPTVEVVSPLSMSFTVSNHAPAVFRFSEPVRITSGAEAFVVSPDQGSGASGAVPGTLEVDPDQRTYRFTPQGGWAQLAWPFPRRYVQFLLYLGAQDLAGNAASVPDWYFYVTRWQLVGGSVPAPLDGWLELAASPGGKLVMEHHDSNYREELLELDAGVWTAFPALPVPDGGEVGMVSMDLQGETLHAASIVYRVPTPDPELRLHRWTVGGWEQLASSSPLDIGLFRLVVAPNGGAFLEGRVGDESAFVVYEASGGSWHQLGGHIPSAVETGGFFARPELAVDVAGTPWIALLEETVSGKVAQVRRWSGLDWETVGPPIGGLTPEELPRLRVDAEGRPIVSYRMQDVGTGFIRIQVVRLEAGSWVPLGSALQGHASPPVSDLEIGVFLRHSMTLRDGQRPVLAFQTGNAGPYGIGLCEWLGTVWSCEDNVAEYQAIYGPPSVAILSGDALAGTQTATFVDGGWVNGSGAIGPNR